MNWIKMYLRFAGVSMSCQMEYRASFLFQTIGQFLITGIDFLGLWTLFARFESLKGWNLYEIMIFYGMIHLGFGITDAFSRGLDVLPQLIRQGDLDRYFLRPQPVLLQILGFEFTLRRIGKMGQGLLVLVIGLWKTPVSWNWMKGLLLGETLLGIICFFFGLMLIQGALSFWTTQGLEAMNVFTYGGVETGQFPITIFQKWFRRFFTYIVPLAFVTYLPLATFLGKQDTLGIPMGVRWFSPLAGILFLAAAGWIFSRGLKKYNSVGS